MKTSMLVLALGAALFAAPAIANDPSEPQAPVKADEPAAAKPVESPEDRMVCERIRATGSNKVERVCKTAKQRAEERNSEKANADRDAAERMMRTRQN
ncbi:hypothetical protein [Lysobacter auxotrophicus]|uniref:Uncharacterized protein n=1 Tax=Lysobacter auxotrophicus TaxID=2992573 RepID=A0ABM8D9X1_9GAMM|nr:hypothetical protein [Lysobacter auxotrophicus]BDU15353.1 hypothetical protein LA521A_05540 [Lysobacter auxotrophicus]